jgi:hypothetical protein
MTLTTPAPARDRPVEGPLEIDRDEFDAKFGLRPFRVRHHLVDHPLFALPRLLELARSLPPGQVEYNAGDLPVDQRPELTPRNGLSVEETIRRIAECKSWLVLKNVELDAEYRELLHRCLAQVEGLGHPAAAGIGRREGFVFVSSPGAVTPYHIDHEQNFLLQVRGSKCLRVFDGNDRTLLSEEELERFYSGAHRNLVYREEHASRAEAFELAPGDGAHVPVTAPHWVQNGPEVSVSFSITIQTRGSERRGTVYQANHWLRGRGLRPTPVGRSVWRDFLKSTGLRVLRRLRRLLGRKKADGPAY